MLSSTGKAAPAPAGPDGLLFREPTRLMPILCRRDGLAPFLEEILGSGLSSNVNLAKKSQQRSSEVLRVTQEIEARTFGTRFEWFRAGANRV
jgi:hypothetical protein